MKESKLSSETWTAQLDWGFFFTLILKNTNFENVVFFFLCPSKILLPIGYFYHKEHDALFQQLCLNSAIAGFSTCAVKYCNSLSKERWNLCHQMFLRASQTFARNNLVLFHSVSQQTVIYHCSSFLSNCLALVSHFLHYLIRKFGATEGNRCSEHWLW